MITNEIVVLRCRRLPAPRSERRQVVTIGHARQPREQIFQVSERVLAVPLARDDQRVQDRRTLAGFGVADEQPVLLADARGPNRVFDQLLSSRLSP